MTKDNWVDDRLLQIKGEARRALAIGRVCAWGPDRPHDEPPDLDSCELAKAALWLISLLESTESARRSATSECERLRGVMREAAADVNQASEQLATLRGFVETVRGVTLNRATRLGDP